MIVKIVPNLKDNPRGKLADAELHFTDGVLDGLKLIGFAVWERRSGGGKTVTFPARQYIVNGDRRSFVLLRPIADAAAQARMRDLVLQAFAEYEAAANDTTSLVAGPGRRHRGGAREAFRNRPEKKQWKHLSLNRRINKTLAAPQATASLFVGRNRERRRDDFSI
jgi:hypothetical protein